MAGEPNYCQHCGAPTGMTNFDPRRQNCNIAYHEKGVGIGILIGLIITGGGQLYAGKIARGICILLAWMFGFVPSMFLVLFLGAYTSASYYSEPSMAPLALMVVIAAVYLVFWIWTLYDTKVLIEKYNSELRKNGRPPW